MEKDRRDEEKGKTDHAVKNKELRALEVEGGMNEKEAAGRHDSLRAKSLNLTANQRGNRGRETATFLKD